MTVIHLKRLEKAQKKTNVRLANVERSLGHISAKLDVHTRHFERMEDALQGIAHGVDRMSDRVDRMNDRVDRLTHAIARGRTQDLVRFDRIERRLTTLETRAKRKPKRR